MGALPSIQRNHKGEQALVISIKALATLREATDSKKFEM